MWKTWFLAARPKTLFASICPVAIGTALAARDGRMHVGALCAALVGAVTIQIGTNFCNDYFDYFQGADTDARVGPTRAVQAGLVSSTQMLIATLASFSLTGIVCIYLVARAGWPLALLGIVSIACGIWYTASRFSLAYLGLGDLFVLVFFGPVAVAGTHYVQSLRLSPAAIVAGLAPGFLSVGILVVNNLRDVEQDAAAQKRTLAVRFGRSFARREYWLCMFATACIPFVLWRQFNFTPAILVSSLAVAPGFYLATKLGQRVGKSLNPLLGQTGAVLLLYTLVFSTQSILT